MKTDVETWYRLCRFFERLFVVNFGAGVATRDGSAGAWATPQTYNEQHRDNAH
jgi:hypothetical protein